MKFETLISRTYEEWSAEASVPAGLADRALRGRARRRSLRVGLAAGSAALLAGAAAVVVTQTGGPQVRPATPIQSRPVAMSSDTSLRTDLGSSFPRHLVAAGHTAIAAYFTGHKGTDGGARTYERTWYLYDPASGVYEKSPWAYLDVQPGMHQAAVLESALASRVGILDMRTRKVVRWIPAANKVGGVSWSPDGRRLLLTTYRSDPDVYAAPGASPRTGFYMVDGATGHGTFHALPADNSDPMRGNPAVRQDFGWSRSGTLIWAPTATAPTKVFYDLNGRPAATPGHEADDGEDAGLSPNGTLFPRFGPIPGPSVTVRNVSTGKTVAVLPIESAEAWADDSHLFAIGCAVKKCTGKGEFRNRLMLISLGGKTTALTGYHRSDRIGAWEPVFTHR